MYILYLLVIACVQSMFKIGRYDIDVKINFILNKNKLK